jgi:hypothetical protein
VAGPAVRPRRRRLGLVEQVVQPRRLLVGEEALGRRALVAVPVVRVPRPRDRAELGVRRRPRSRRHRERAPRREQRLLLEPPVRHHGVGVLTQTAQRKNGEQKQKIAKIRETVALKLPRRKAKIQAGLLRLQPQISSRNHRTRQKIEKITANSHQGRHVHGHNGIE